MNELFYDHVTSPGLSQRLAQVGLTQNSGHFFWIIYREYTIGNPRGIEKKVLLTADQAQDFDLNSDARRILSFKVRAWLSSELAKLLPFPVTTSMASDNQNYFVSTDRNSYDPDANPIERTECEARGLAVLYRKTKKEARSNGKT